MPPERPQACRPAGSPSTNPQIITAKKEQFLLLFYTRLIGMQRLLDLHTPLEVSLSEGKCSPVLWPSVPTRAAFLHPNERGGKACQLCTRRYTRMLGMCRLPVLHAPLSVSLPEGKCSPILCPPHKLSSCSIFLPHKGGMGALPPWLSIALDLSCPKDRSPLPP